MVGMIVVVAVLAVLPCPAPAWETVVGSNRGDEGVAIVSDAAGRVFAGGALYADATDRDLAVVALNGPTGAELWRFVVDGGIGEPDRARRLVIDAGGDVIALGWLDTGLGAASVLKLDGATGAQIWRRDFPDPLDGQGVAVDGAGDVFAALGDFGGGGGALFKLDGATGADVWQTPTCAFGPVAVDAIGDVFSQSPSGEVCKTNGATGASLWIAPTAIGATDLAVGPLGDVALAGGDGFIVVKLSGATGMLQWQKTLGIGLFGDRSNTVAFAGGDVIAGGVIEDAPDYHVVKFDGTTGAEVWRGRGIWFEDSAPGEVLDLSVTAAGNVMAASHGSVTLFRASDGRGLWSSNGGAPLALDPNDLVISTTSSRGWRVLKGGGPLAGQALTVLETPGGTKVVLKSKDRTILLPLVVDQFIDPLRPEDVGAVLELRNPSTMESDTISLPAVNWSSSGFGAVKYVDRDGSEGPCRKAKITRKVLKVSCKGSAFTLDEPTQGSLQATLSFGGDPLARQCGEFGGSIRLDVPGAFKATNAPPPAICP